MKVWKDAEVVQLNEMTLQGKKQSEIANALGRSKREVTQKIYDNNNREECGRTCSNCVYMKMNGAYPYCSAKGNNLKSTRETCAWHNTLAEYRDLCKRSAERKEKARKKREQREERMRKILEERAKRHEWQNNESGAGQ